MSRLLSYVIILVFIGVSYSQSRWERRDKWQNVDGIFKAMKIKDGSVVADIGSKDGYLTLKLAKAVGSGTVYAVDIDEEALDDLQSNLDKEDITNVKKVLSETDDPKLPKNSVDAIIILNAYHEMTEYESMLKHMKAALKEDGLLVIVDGIDDSRKDSDRKTQTNKHELSYSFAKEEVENAGFEIVESNERFVTNHPWRDVQWIMSARVKKSY